MKQLRTDLLFPVVQAQEQNITTLPEDVVNKAVAALIGFQDHNYDSPSPVYCFWPQVEENGTWIADPTNIQSVVKLLTAGKETIQAFYIP